MADGAATIDDDTVLLGIGVRCGAGFYCGGCVPAIQALLDCRRGVLPETEEGDFQCGVLEVRVELPNSNLIEAVGLFCGGGGKAISVIHREPDMLQMHTAVHHRAVERRSRWFTVSPAY